MRRLSFSLLLATLAEFLVHERPLLCSTRAPLNNCILETIHNRRDHTGTRSMRTMTYSRSDPAGNISRFRNAFAVFDFTIAFAMRAVLICDDFGCLLGVVSLALTFCRPDSTWHLIHVVPTRYFPCVGCTPTSAFDRIFMRLSPLAWVTTSPYVPNASAFGCDLNTKTSEF